MYQLPIVKCSYITAGKIVNIAYILSYDYPRSLVVEIDKEHVLNNLYLHKGNQDCLNYISCISNLNDTSRFIKVDRSEVEYVD
jgi:hypothetical protein